MDDFPGLQALLGQLVGEPFRFARVSYGEELTIHFGALRLGRSPKLKTKPYGVFILGLRGSSWVLNAGTEPVVPAQFVEPESRVVVALPLSIRPMQAIGLQLVFADGSSFLVLPNPQEPDAADEESLPELADWELISLQGFLRVGPGIKWSFETTRNSALPTAE